MTRHRSRRPARLTGPIRRRHWAEGVVGVVVSVLALTAGVAAPASATPSAPASAPASGYACWADLSTGLSLCVDEGVDLVAAVAREYGVRLAVPDGAIPGSLASSARLGSADPRATASTVISVIYDNTSYGGGSYSLSVGSGCGWGHTSLSSLGWNDRASSYRSFNGCSTALFANEGYTGTSTGYAGSASSLGGMNDQGSSWSVH